LCRKLLITPNRKPTSDALQLKITVYVGGILERVTRGGVTEFCHLIGTGTGTALGRDGRNPMNRKSPAPALTAVRQ
jgi:hypothetical protein